MNCPKYMQAKYCLCSAFIQFLETIKINELFWTIFFLVRMLKMLHFPTIEKLSEIENKDLIKGYFCWLKSSNPTCQI